MGLRFLAKTICAAVYIVTGILATGVLATARADILASVSLRATDLGGNPISSIAVGQSFQIQAIVQDLRQPVSARLGAFVAYSHASYDPSRVFINPSATVTFGPTFESLAGSSDLSSPGAISAGAFGFLSPPGDVAQLLWSIPASATQAGLEVFTSSADDGAGHDIELYGLNDALDNEQVQFVGTTLQIVPEPSSVALCLIGSLALLAAGVRRWTKSSTGTA